MNIALGYPYNCAILQLIGIISSIIINNSVLIMTFLQTHEQKSLWMYICLDHCCGSTGYYFPSFFLA